MANAEVLIIGRGIAGATAALRLARNSDRQITIITRASDAHESNTRYAQGGIIGRGPDDSAELLFEDIVAAGLHEFLDGLQTKLNQVDDAIYSTFFRIAPLAASGG